MFAYNSDIQIVDFVQFLSLKINGSCLALF